MVLYTHITILQYGSDTLFTQVQSYTTIAVHYSMVLLHHLSKYSCMYPYHHGMALIPCFQGIVLENQTVTLQYGSSKLFI